MQLILARHGRTESNALHRFPLSPAVPLDRTGIEQVRCTGRQIDDSGFHPTAIHASDAERTLQTARLLRDLIAPELPVTPQPGLRELDWGLLRGRSTLSGPSGDAEYTRWQQDPLRRLPGGESLADVQARATPVLERLIADGRPALVVSHAVTLTVLTAWLRGWDLIETWQSHRAHLPTGGYRRLELTGPPGLPHPLPVSQ
ncbi:histidine phosphatase family protein [Streptomyces sp. AB3(2024)]|uniref:histidine phosphatase family protein n=1 Tax=Streptomyces sp. AB3(2024) TaxID=3317321 RepID=UPI0035A3439B